MIFIRQPANVMVQFPRFRRRRVLPPGRPPPPVSCIKGVVSIKGVLSRASLEQSRIFVGAGVCGDAQHCDNAVVSVAKVNGVPGVMDQGESVPATGTSSTPLVLVDVTEEPDEELHHDEEPDEDSQQHSQTPSQPIASSTSVDHQSTATRPRTRAANLVGCRSTSTATRPSKRAKLERTFVDFLDRFTNSIVEVEKVRTEAALKMHKDNLIERQENWKFRLELFQAQLAFTERMAAMLADVVKKNAH